MRPTRAAAPPPSIHPIITFTISSTASPPSQTTTRPAAAHPRLLLVSQRHRCSIGAAIAAPMFHRCRSRPRAPGLSSPGGLNARSVLVLDGADDLAEQGGELVLLALAQTGADQRLARVERGEQALDNVAALGFQ